MSRKKITLLEAVQTINDINQAAVAVTALVQTAMAAGESGVDAEDVAKARDSLNGNIAKLDAMIAAARAGD